MRQASPEIKQYLWSHRTNRVRPEARAAQLLYGFIRNVPYRSIEPKCRPIDDYRLRKIQEKAKRFGVEVAEFMKWLNAEVG
jgi:hypothetical protein